MPDPEALARIEIDRLLTEAGWLVVDRDQANIFAGRGIAIREVSIPGAGEADYLLIADKRAIGIIEAKAQGITLSGVEPQTKAYAEGMPGFAKPWMLPLPMLYESTGIETRFTNLLDPEPRSRRVFAFHRPETLVGWVQAEVGDGGQGRHGVDPYGRVAEDGAAYDTGATLAGRLQRLPVAVDDPKLWPAQRLAITNLERSLRQHKPRALIQMATGSGKTFTAISAIYRLIRYADARRVLFLVDRANLGRQTFREFQAFETPDDGRTFTELYNVQHLKSNVIDTSASRVCISTIQRIYSILSGQPDLDESLEEGSTFEGGLPFDPKVVTYNPNVPIETFDVIVIDEAHRSIFNLWSQVLEYFDATLIGLTATPNKQAFAFFNQNLVMEYTHEDAVADNVNVPFDIYPIKTRITQEGGTVEAEYHLQYRDRKTRAERWQQLDEDFTYAAPQLDRDVVVPDQIRTVVKTFRDKLFTEIFPGRTEVPKTLIFAKDDSHADDIVRIVREEFGKGNEFCQKITYRTTGIKPEDLLAQFRNNFYPRIVVTVDMIATGTDVKPIEIVMFMRTVKSCDFEQMKGRGVRVMPTADLKRVTADAKAKTHFVIVDAVGVTELEMKDAPPPLERKRSVGFRPLIERIAFGQTEEANLTSLASRLVKLDKVLSPDAQEQFRAVSGGRSLGDVVRQVLAATDPDVQIGHAREATGLSADAIPDEAAIEAARVELAERVQEVVANPDLRNTLIALQEQSEQVIDSISQDEVLVAGFSTGPDERARATTQRFSEFIAEHQDEITALQIIFGQPYAQRKLHYQDLKELAARITAPPRAWTPDALWDAYAQLDRNKVRKTGTRTLTDLVSLVRYATGQEDELVPFCDRVNERFEAWLGQHEAGGRHFTSQQRQWLDLIRDHIVQSTAMEQEDFDDVPFAQHGGLGRYYDLFGDDYLTILDDLNGTLVA